jgi:hypothetical protein
MIADRWLALLIAVWTAFTWGGRIGLLTGDESGMAKLRISVSVGLAVLAVIGLASRVPWRRAAVAAYAAGVFVIWGSSLISVMTDPGTSVPFRLVHTFLALGSMTLAGYAFGRFRRSEPGEARPLAAPSRVGR